MSNIFYSAFNVTRLFKTAPDTDEDLGRMHGIEDALNFTRYWGDGSEKNERALIRAALWMTRPNGIDAIDNMPHSREAIDDEGDFGKRIRMAQENERRAYWIGKEAQADKLCWQAIEARGRDISNHANNFLAEVIREMVVRSDLDGGESVAWVERARNALLDLSEADRRGLTLPEWHDRLSRRAGA